MKPKRRRGLVELRPGELLAETGAARFLGRLDASALRGEFEAAGLLTGLAQRGFSPVSLDLSREQDEHRLLVRATGPGAEEMPPLVELRCAEPTLLLRDLDPRPEGVEVLSVLAIRWLAMQDPLSRFTPARPRLPGQRYPGLGLARPLILRLRDWARAWGKDALVNFPEFFHNAVFYSAFYRFASARLQGRFEALRRDLAGLDIASASHAVEDGRVIEEPAGSGLRWEAGEMLLPLTEPVRDFLEGAAYQAARERTCEAVRFWVRGEAA